MTRRVVVTGLGIVSSLGNNKKKFKIAYIMLALASHFSQIMLPWDYAHMLQALSKILILKN